MGYYKEINGKKLDGQLIELAEKAVKGDGIISKGDAEILLKSVTDGGQYTDVEKDTVEFIHTQFHWTDHARDWFHAALAEWRNSRQMTVKMTPEELAAQHFAKDDVLTGESARAARSHDLHTATVETYQDHDEISILVRLSNGQKVEVTSNFIELEGEYVELKGGHLIPVRAIEKVEI